MGFFPESDSIYIFRREQPYPSITESLKVLSGKVFLKEIPDSFQHVTIQDPNNISTVFVETTSTTLTGSNYRVDYKMGIVYLSTTYEGDTLNFSYYGTGVWSIPASRVYDDITNGTPSQTIHELVDTMNQNYDKFAEMDTKISDTETARQNAIAANK